MILLLPYIFSSLIGFLAMQLILGKSIQLNKTLNVTLSAALGIGLTATLTFYSLFIFSGFSRRGILILHLILLLILFGIQAPKLWAKTRRLTWGFNFLAPIAWIGWGLLLHAIQFLAKMHPYGEWDAWALYNMKTKFLIFSGSNWQAIFNELHWYTQPDYPLLLPSINVFSYAVTNASLSSIPMTTGIVLAMLISWLMFGGLKQITHTTIAFLASFLLLANPFYIFQSTAQYADTLLAFYLLAGIISLKLTLVHFRKSSAWLTGLLLGFMTFSKNEGIVMSILLIGCFMVYLLARKAPKKDKRKSLILIPCLLGGFLLTSSPAIILKLFLAPPNKDIFGGLSTVHMQFLNWKGFTLILDAIMYETTHRRWAFIWIFIIFLAAAANIKLFYKECKVFLAFLFLYLCVLTLIYLTTVNFDLSWRLKSTIHRICYYLLPSLLFFCYYAIFRKKTINRSVL